MVCTISINKRLHIPVHCCLFQFTWPLSPATSSLHLTLDFTLTCSVSVVTRGPGAACSSSPGLSHLPVPPFNCLNSGLYLDLFRKCGHWRARCRLFQYSWLAVSSQTCQHRCCPAGSHISGGPQSCMCLLLNHWSCLPEPSNIFFLINMCN